MRLLPSLCLLLLLSGCAQMEANRRVDEYREVLDPLLGASEEEVVAALGAPDDVRSLELESGPIDVWEYRKSFGYRGGVGGSDVYRGGNVREAFDACELVFKDGVMVRWDCDVQR